MIEKFSLWLEIGTHAELLVIHVLRVEFSTPRFESRPGITTGWQIIYSYCSHGVLT